MLLLCSAHGDQRAIMTLGWHMMLGYDLVGTYVWEDNHSHALARRSRECTLNVPGVDLLDAVVGIGNCSSGEVDKFRRFGLTPTRSREVSAPGIGQCHAILECRLHEARITRDYPLFVWRVLRLRVAVSPALPRTVHYRGGGGSWCRAGSLAARLFPRLLDGSAAAARLRLAERNAVLTSAACKPRSTASAPRSPRSRPRTWRCTTRATCTAAAWRPTTRP